MGERMNDPIKVRQPGGVLEFVQQPNTNYYAESPCGNYGFKVWRGVGNAHLEVFDGSTEEIFYVKSPAAIPPTTLFAIAETIHARLTGRDLSPTVSRAELEEETHRVLDMIDSPELSDRAVLELACLQCGGVKKPAESVNAELLEACKRASEIIRRHNGTTDSTYRSAEKVDDARIILNTAIDRAEAQQ
jgi:hypothetical protein